MADDTPAASFTFDLRFMKKGKYSAILYLPESHLRDIGAIIAYWGMFEIQFNNALTALVDAERAEGITRNIRPRQRFKGRRELFKSICQEWLATWDAETAKTLCAIADTAGDLAKKRNLIAHGVYTYTIPAQSSLATNCVATDIETGKRLPFNEFVLKKLYHDIAHLVCDLHFAMSRIAEIEGACPSLPDTEVQRVYRETNHPWHPNPKKRTPPPESSQG